MPVNSSPNMQPIWKTSISPEILHERGKNSIVEVLGIEFTEIGDNYLSAKMPVDYRTKQPIGIMHGGSSCVLAETVGSTAANFCVDITQQYCVGLSIYTNHIKSVRSGFVIGTATPIHVGKTTQIWNIDIASEDKKLVSSTRLVMMVLDR